MRLIISVLCCIMSSSLFADVFLIKLKEDKKSYKLSSQPNNLSEQQIFLDGASFDIKSNNKIQTISLPVEKEKHSTLINYLSTKTIDPADEKLFNQAAVIKKITEQNPGKIELILPADLELTLFDDIDNNNDETPVLIQGYDNNQQLNMVGPNSINIDKLTGNYDLANAQPITVAIIDSGLARNIPDYLKNKVLSQGGHFQLDPSKKSSIFAMSFDNNIADNSKLNHGTHVAGIVANSTMFNDKVKILMIKVFEDTHKTSMATLIPAIEWALGVEPKNFIFSDFFESLPPVNKSPARVLNLSLGSDFSDLNKKYGRAFVDSKLQPIKDNTFDIFKILANIAKQKKAVLIFAEGNESKDVKDVFPQNTPNADFVLVQAIGKEGNLTHYTNYGSIKGNHVVSAPGGDYISSEIINGALKDMSPLEKIIIARRLKVYQDPQRGILSTVDNGYTYMQGTSMAAPHVAGVASLMLSTNPDLNTSQIGESLIKSQGGTDFTCKAELHKNKGILSASKKINIGAINATKAITCVLEK